MNDPFEPFVRQLGESLRSEERVAWLGRRDTRPMGDCLPSGSRVLCHPRFPAQFRIDNARHRAEFRRHGFTWTDAAAEELGAWRFGQLPETAAADPVLFTGDQRRRSESAARKEMADLDLNLKGAKGTRFPWGGGERWWDGVVLPFPTVTQVERVGELSEAFAAAWEEAMRDPGLEAWPAAFRAEFLKHNRIGVYRLGSSRGRTIHVVVGYVSPVVLAFAPAEEVAARGDGLRVEWRPWDLGVGRLVREVYQRWKSRHAAGSDPFTYYSIGLDVRHTTLPELLVPAADVELWECLWVADGGDRLVSRTPPRAGFKRFRRDFSDRLLPETAEERFCRVRTVIDRYRRELFGGSINIKLLREVTGYRRSVLRDVLLELEQRDGTGEKGYAVRLPKDKAKADLDYIEVVTPSSGEGRAVKAKWYRPSWWIYWMWVAVPMAVSGLVAAFVPYFTQSRSLPPWQLGLITCGTGLLGAVVKDFAAKRAKDVEDE